MHILSNDWWTWAWATYNYSILGFPAVVGFMLKIVAIYHPSVQSDKVIDLIKQYWPTQKPTSG